MKKITAKFLNENLIVDEVSKSKDGFIAREGFFYLHGKTAGDLRENIEKQLGALNLKFKIVDFGEKWRAYKGGASLRTQSHWFVKFEII